MSWNKKIVNFDFILLEPETTQQNYNEEEKVWDGTGMGLDMDLAHAVNNALWSWVEFGMGIWLETEIEEIWMHAILLGARKESGMYNII